MRGLNDPLKQKEVKQLVRKYNLSLIGLLEHKIKEPNSNRILNSMLPNWSFANNYPCAPVGRICVSWDPSIITLIVLAQSNQAIHCQIQSVSGGVHFLATFVYGSNIYFEREILQHDLSIWNSSSPWVILGDFNALCYPSDKVGGNRHWPSYMDAFSNCICSNEVDDLRYSGCQLPGSISKTPIILSPQRLIGCWLMNLG